MNLFRKMYSQSFFHTPVPLCREEEWGGCAFSVSVTLPVWTSKRLSNLPKVTNNSLACPDNFQYMCWSTSPLWRVCISVPSCIWWLSLACTITSAQPGSLIWREVGVLFPGINLSANLIMVEGLGLPLFTFFFSPNLCWKILKGCSCGSEVYCPVLISVCNDDAWLTAHLDTSWPPRSLCGHSQIFWEVLGASPWCINRNRNKTAKQ